MKTILLRPCERIAKSRKVRYGMRIGYPTAGTIGNALVGDTECIAAVEQALADMDEGRNLIPFGEVCRQWKADKLTQ